MHGDCALLTLGCKVNQYESQEMREQLESAGYKIVDAGGDADLFVVNTCAVTQTAEKKCRQIIRRVAARCPKAVIVVTGCMAQRAGADLKRLSERLIILGNVEKEDILAYITGEVSCTTTGLGNCRSYRGRGIGNWNGRARAFVKIQDGCNRNCAYCLVPQVRGRLRSRPARAAYDEIRRLADNGFREVVLTGIHLGLYNERKGDGLAKFLSKLPDIEGIVNIRLSSIEATDFTSDLLSVIKNDNRICNHMHVPLQHGSDQILGMMRRSYTAIEYARVIDSLRAIRPGLAVTTDVMVGFPGEDDAAFQESLSFIRKMGFAGLHIFRYSRRPGTPAAVMPNQVGEKIKSARAEEMAQTADGITDAYLASIVNEKLRLVVEKIDNSLCMGRTDRYVEAEINSQPDFSIGDVVSVRALGKNNGRLLGKALKKVL
jgi:threonylcarbamoyladenosine tRNA methylthiotransferase MtaB